MSDSCPSALAAYERLLAAQRDVPQWERDEAAKESARESLAHKIKRKLEKVA